MTYAAAIPAHGAFDIWRTKARVAISHRIPPDEVDWSEAEGLFAASPLPATPGPHQAQVPPAFVSLARSAICHSAPERFGLLYQALWRLDAHDGDPLDHADPLGKRLFLMSKAVRRDIHKMHAFVRFRELPANGQRRSFAAWFEPDHNTLEAGTPFFVKRFSDMDWLIATPQLTAQFRDGSLTFLPGGPRPDLPEDASEALWATYFANIFNPARIKLDAMRAEMPKKYWKNLPETRLIPEMLQDAEARVERMRAAGSTTPRPGATAVSTRYRSAMPQPVELPDTLDEACEAALSCRRCGLCEAATQTVWGQGNPEAGLMIVGEQPGDHEDLQGQPFVGPAGLLLHDAMEKAGVAANRVWLTNAVKHFKFEPRGKRRLHKNPDRSEIVACRWWLGLEIGFVQPRLTLALGASAAFALTGNAAPLTPRRGKVEQGLHGGPVMISWHPSAILRQRDQALASQVRHELTADLGEAMRMAEAV